MRTQAVRLAFYVCVLPAFLASEAQAQEIPAREKQTASELAILARPPRQILPPLECLHCYGPPPAKYCLPGNGPRGYLYYGSYPYDDDWFNRFDDCPGGNCGHVGTALGLGWIQLHNAHRSHDRRRALHHAR